MFKDPLLNKKLKDTKRMLWRKKNTGILSTLGSKKLGRRSKAYAVWRKYVFKRDGFKCVRCGSSERIHAHHKKDWYKNRDQSSRFNVNNGVTLCFKCHKLIHPWLE